jgi:CBS domain-containing protein
MNAADIMTQPVISICSEATIAEAARLMLQHRISGLPVTDAHDAVVGVVTEADLLRRAELGTERRRPRWIEFLTGPGRLASDYVDAHARKVSEVMTGTVVSVTPQEPLSDVVSLMEKRHIKRVPVVEQGRLVGIISRANLVRALVHRLKGAEVASAKTIATDTDIRFAILAVIEKEPWSPRFSVDVTVKDGVAELDGVVTDERERIALRVAAENVPGVKAVSDHLVWVESISGFVVEAPQDEAKAS